jgi:hypothetical protein
VFGKFRRGAPSKSNAKAEGFEHPSALPETR